jgi:DNA/RNA-binding domain of Phe-tRNA-synthetase-like protein
MVQTRIDPFIQQALPDLRLGLVEAEDVEVRAHDPALWTMLMELSERLRVEYKGKVAADRPEIAATRRAYRALGDDPTRYRAANEALLRRVLSRHSLPQINTIVDINNYISLESGFSLGCYDLAHVQGAIVVRRGAPGEQYAPIGKPEVDAANRLALADDLGIFGSPTADSQRTMVTEAARHTLFVVFAFEASPEAVERSIAHVADLLTTFCKATIVGRQALGG